MIPEVEGMKSKLRQDILEANKYAANVIDEFKLDLLDLHFYFHNQIHRRAKDGIHWDSTGNISIWKYQLTSNISIILFLLSS